MQKKSNQRPGESQIQEHSNVEVLKNPFDEMSDATALEAAARIAETAAFNLATELGPDEAARLIVISHQISEVLSQLDSTGAANKSSQMIMH